MNSTCNHYSNWAEERLNDIFAAGFEIWGKIHFFTLSIRNLVQLSRRLMMSEGPTKCKHNMNSCPMLWFSSYTYAHRVLYLLTTRKTIPMRDFTAEKLNRLKTRLSLNTDNSPCIRQFNSIWVWDESYRIFSFWSDTIFSPFSLRFHEDFKQHSASKLARMCVSRAREGKKRVLSFYSWFLICLHRETQQPKNMIF